nr:MAG TPA: hypothetical protein [Bacteriophage sp.]
MNYTNQLNIFSLHICLARSNPLLYLAHRKPTLTLRFPLPVRSLQETTSNRLDFSCYI